MRRTAAFPLRAPLPWPWREDLIQRLRYAYEEYDHSPEPLPNVVAHVLQLPSREAALDCRNALPSGQVREATIRHEPADDWVLCALYPELPPNPDYGEREQVLRQTVQRFGGRYSGSQRASG